MGFFYFDGRIRTRADSLSGRSSSPILTLRPLFLGLLPEAGLKPGIDEFKSGALMVANPKQASARETLRGLFVGINRREQWFCPLLSGKALVLRRLLG